MPQFERDIRDFRANLIAALNQNLERVYDREFRCEHEYPETRTGACDAFPCGNPDVIRECICCGGKRCRRHTHYCCDQYWCEYCLEAHQTEDGHIPFAELVA